MITLRYAKDIEYFLGNYNITRVKIDEFTTANKVDLDTESALMTIVFTTLTQLVSVVGLSKAGTVTNILDKLG